MVSISLERKRQWFHQPETQWTPGAREVTDGTAESSSCVQGVLHLQCLDRLDHAAQNVPQATQRCGVRGR